MTTNKLKLNPSGGFRLRDYELMTEVQQKKALTTIMRLAFQDEHESIRGAFDFWKMTVVDDFCDAHLFWHMQTPIYQRTEASKNA